MPDQCSSCMFGQHKRDWGNNNLQRICCVQSPDWGARPLTTIPNAANPVIQDAGHWPTVADTDWCGQGVDNATGRPFNQVIPSFTTVAKLPPATPALAGTKTYVTDAVTGHSVGSTLTGGGTLTMPVYCSGTAWLAG